MSGLLADLYSAGDRMKRKLGGLLSDPMGTIALGSQRMAEDTNALTRLVSEAGYMPNTVNRSDQSVLVSERQKALARALLADKATEMGGMAAPIVFHGTRNPNAISGLIGKPGGLKMMDGIGPHVGTAEAANERLMKNNGIKNWAKPSDAAEGAYIMPFDLNPAKEFVKQNGQPYTEAELQSKLSALAVKLGFDKSKTRAYSSAYPAGYEMKQAQQAVRDHLRQQGYDAVPYINSHEARGSTSYVVLDPEKLLPLFGGGK